MDLWQCQHCLAWFEGRSHVPSECKRLMDETRAAVDASGLLDTIDAFCAGEGHRELYPTCPFCTGDIT